MDKLLQSWRSRRSKRSKVLRPWLRDYTVREVVLVSVLRAEHCELKGMATSLMSLRIQGLAMADGCICTVQVHGTSSLLTAPLPLPWPWSGPPPFTPPQEPDRVESDTGDVEKSRGELKQVSSLAVHQRSGVQNIYCTSTYSRCGNKK